jgi:hypothetical protein
MSNFYEKISKIIFNIGNTILYDSLVIKKGNEEIKAAPV